MCGILGFYNLELSVDNLLDIQHHRGPDARGAREIKISNGTKLTLAHNRLKIVCLSDVANQPFTDTSQNHFLVFNGEIYNHIELRARLIAQGVSVSTNSDTEVLLLALKFWGIDCVNYLNGMFAFAYFDSHNLYLVRDRFGVKPLYYYHDGNRLLFASSAKAIAKALNLKPNLLYVNYGLRYGIYPENFNITPYDGVDAVEPGTIVQFSFKSNVRKVVNKYYDLELQANENRERYRAISSENISNVLNDILVDSVKLRLQADVPVAVSLSGGLDSSIIAGLSKMVKTDLTGFCFGDLQDKNSEATLAKETAELNNINLIFVKASSQEWVDAFAQTINYQEAPFCGLSIVAQFLLYKKVKESGFKVLLGGQGADESFLGYRKFQLIYLRYLVEQQNWLGIFKQLFNFSRVLWADRSKFVKYWTMRNKYLHKSGMVPALQMPGKFDCTDTVIDADLRMRQFDDILKFSLPTLLRYEDRNSMAHSIESRLPFMDYRLIELACSLPFDQLIKNGYGKWVLRNNFKHYVTPEISHARYKRGFDISNSQNILNEIVSAYKSKITTIHNDFKGYIDFSIDDYLNVNHYVHHSNRFTELVSLIWLSENM